jgi:hypothetical protein
LSQRNNANPIKQWRSWWRGLTTVEQLVVEVVGAVFAASLLASVVALLW